MSYFSFSKKHVNFLEGASSVLNLFPQDEVYTPLAKKYCNAAFTSSDLDQLTYQAWKDVGSDINHSLMHASEILPINHETNRHKS